MKDSTATLEDLNRLIKAAADLEEMKQLIKEGNDEASKLKVTGKSRAAYYNSYWGRLVNKLEDITGETINFGVLYFPCNKRGTAE